MPQFPGVDFLDFDSVLTDEEKLARGSARQFVDEEILPIIEQYNREGKFPVQLVPQMAELGLFGASLKGYGCAGMSNVEYGLVTQELERGDSGLRSFVSVQSALVMYPIHAFGSDQQKDKWLPLMQQGKAIGCFGLTEPQFGSNPGGMLTRAQERRRPATSSTAKKCGSPTAPSPTSPSSGRNVTTKQSAASSSKKARPASKPGTSTENILCALPSPAAFP